MSEVETKKSILQHIFNRRIALCFYTGLMSGLPYYIFTTLVTAWLATNEVSLKDIGLMSTVMLPYAWKFLWAPFVDKFYITKLGRRKTWLFITQLVIALATVALPLFSPQDSLTPVVYLCVLLTFFSATQDIVIDAYRREILEEEELGVGNQVHVQVWRLAYFIPGSLGLIMANYIEWQWVFLMVASFMLLGLCFTAFVAEPTRYDEEDRSIKVVFVEPFLDFFSLHGVKQALLIILFMFLYKLGDNMATTLATPFYLEMGYTLEEIGAVAKLAGFLAALVGGIAGGIWMIKLGIYRALWVFGFVQILSIPGYYVLASSSKSLWLLGGAVAFEYLGIGLGTAALVAYTMKMTSIKYAATQLAVLTALNRIPSILAGASTGFIVDSVGWKSFFIVCFFTAIPGMLLLFKIAPWNKVEQ